MFRVVTLSNIADGKLEQAFQEANREIMSAWSEGREGIGTVVLTISLKSEGAGLVTASGKVKTTLPDRVMVDSLEVSGGRLMAETSSGKPWMPGLFERDENGELVPAGMKTQTTTPDPEKATGGGMNHISLDGTGEPGSEGEGEGQAGPSEGDTTGEKPETLSTKRTRSRRAKKVEETPKAPPELPEAEAEEKPKRSRRATRPPYSVEPDPPEPEHEEENPFPEGWTDTPDED